MVDEETNAEIEERKTRIMSVLLKLKEAPVWIRFLLWFWPSTIIDLVDNQKIPFIKIEVTFKRFFGRIYVLKERSACMYPHHRWSEEYVELDNIIEFQNRKSGVTEHEA